MIISSFYPIIGGAERQAQQLAAKLLSRGIDVCVLTRRYTGLLSYQEIDGVPVFRLPAPGGRLVAAFSYLIFAVRWLRSYRGRQYSVIHAHQALSPAIIGILDVWGNNRKVIVKIACSGAHGDVAQMEQLPFLTLRRHLLRRVDTFVAVNSETEAELRHLGLTSPVVFIPNGVDTTYFVPPLAVVKQSLRKALGLPSIGQVAVFVGRLESQKNTSLLLQAWSNVIAQQEDAKLLVVGQGTQRAVLEQQARGLGLEKHVRFVGQVDNVRDYLHAADIFVLPSKAEGLSNSLLEAMACGLPVVVSAIGGNTDAVREGVEGLLIPPDNESALANALLDIVSNPALMERLGANARQTAVERFSLESVTEHYISLYHSLCEGEGSIL
jgi:glycosyltransferase involved in cell wall biosynthesis